MSDRKFYRFHQNNSGGYFDGPVNVIVEARSGSEANQIAQDRAGIYFDGVEKGFDCECCGDRWYPCWDEEKGDDVPSEYGVPLDESDLKDADRYLVIRYGE